MNRLPKDYEGINHQTLGSDIIAIVRTLRFPEQSLGKESFQKLSTIKPDGWYPVDIILELTQRLSTNSGVLVLRQMGRKMFETSHSEAFKKNVHTVRQFAHGIDAMYRLANRGQKIGGWSVEKFEPGTVLLKKNTPHHCAIEEGIILEALSCLGVVANISQPKCFHNGDEYCLFRVESRSTKGWE